MYISELSLEIQLSEEVVWVSIDRFNHVTFCSLPKPEHGLPSSDVVLFMFNGLVWEVVVCFVDIDGIVDHHCLNFL